MANRRYKYMEGLAVVFFLQMTMFVFTGEAKVITVQNPGNNKDIQPFLAKAVNEAVAGDEIQLPAGEFKFTGIVVIEKKVSISGAGMDKTILYRTQEESDDLLSDEHKYMLLYEINSTQSANIKISQIGFRSKKPQAGKQQQSLAKDIAIKLIGCVDFSISNCRFQFFGEAAVAVNHADEVSKGLIYKNEFLNNARGPNGMGLGYGIVVYGSNKKWITPAGFGTDNFIFIEDNLFIGQRHAIAAGGCGRYVFRYNKVIDNNIGEGSSHAVDAHEARQTPGDNYYSARAVEIYNDEIRNNTFMDKKPITKGRLGDQLVENAILIRGGEALIHHNNISGYRFGIGIVNFEVKGKQQYPIFTQPGYSSGLKHGAAHRGQEGDKGDGDLFAWENKFKPYISEDSSQEFYNYREEYFIEGRDYHLQARAGYKPYPYPHPARQEVKTSQQNKPPIKTK